MKYTRMDHFNKVFTTLEEPGLIPKMHIDIKKR